MGCGLGSRDHNRIEHRAGVIGFDHGARLETAIVAATFKVLG